MIKVLKKLFLGPLVLTDDMTPEQQLTMLLRDRESVRQMERNRR